MGFCPIMNAKKTPATISVSSSACGQSCKENSKVIKRKKQDIVPSTRVLRSQKQKGQNLQAENVPIDPEDLVNSRVKPKKKPERKEEKPIIKNLTNKRNETKTKSNILEQEHDGIKTPNKFFKSKNEAIKNNASKESSVRNDAPTHKQEQNSVKTNALKRLKKNDYTKPIKKVTTNIEREVKDKTTKSTTLENENINMQTEPTTSATIKKENINMQTEPITTTTIIEEENINMQTEASVSTLVKTVLKNDKKLTKKNEKEKALPEKSLTPIRANILRSIQQDKKDLMLITKKLNDHLTQLEKRLQKSELDSSSEEDNCSCEESSSDNNFNTSSNDDLSSSDNNFNTNFNDDLSSGDNNFKDDLSFSDNNFNDDSFSNTNGNLKCALLIFMLHRYFNSLQ